LVQLETEGKSEYTKRNIEKFLQLINRKADLDNPKEVLLFISRHDCSNSMKECLCYAYRRYCKYYQIEAKIPFYQHNSKPIHVPTKEKLTIIISNASGALLTKLNVSIETGVRPIELQRLKVKDVDIEQKLLYPTTAKHGASRTLKISLKLATMIREHVIKHNLQPNDQLFKGTATQYGKNFRVLRNRLAEKLHDPTLRTIRLYDFRHYFCTKKCYEIKNPWIVMNLMGHKRLETTQIYMHLLNLEESEWVCEGAETKQQAMKLIEAGFQYVTTIEDTQLFKKPK
jgi:integrase